MLTYTCHILVSFISRKLKCLDRCPNVLGKEAHVDEKVWLWVLYLHEEYRNDENENVLDWAETL